MLFTSPEFLYAFLPLCFLVYFTVGIRYRNLVLLCASLAFYACLSGQLTMVLIASIVGNHLLARRLHLDASGRRRRAVFAASVTFNLLPLLYYKYAGFGLTVLGDASSFVGLRLWPADPKWVLPAGISFFTFQGISYVADVYLRRVAPARSLVDFGMYHSCFPQLIAGPIVRYEQIRAEICGRHTALDDFYNGAVQFCLGLAKKAVLADTLGKMADQAFDTQAAALGLTFAWLGLLAYTLQIYLDFSGYSDMAIGLGRMFGFHYPENFNQPYRSRSVTEFWRRWHMTLSGWFRDYVYIPLGGNRDGPARTVANLFVVFLLCGLWHGAAYTFVVWGLYHGALLVLERLLRRWSGTTLPPVLGWLWTMSSVMLGWVLFRAASLTAALDYARAMIRLPSPPAAIPPELTPDRLTYLGLALLVALFPFDRVVTFADSRYDFSLGWSAIALCAAAFSLTMLSVNGFTPFIYFRF